MTSYIAKRNNVTILGQLGKKVPAIVMAHGFGSDQTAWRYLVEVFAPHYPIVLFDHVGSGKSDFSSYSPYRYTNLHSFAADLLEICRELSLERCIFFAHSVSCMVGLLAALIEPQRFQQLFFIGASPRYLNDQNYIGGFEQSDLDTLYAAMSANYYAWASGFAPLAMGNPNRPELALEFANTLSAIRPDISFAIAKMIFQSDHRSDLPKLKVPTVVIQSQNDIAVPPFVGKYLSEHIPRSQLVNINAEGHLPHLSAPQAVIQAISPHLTAL